MKYSFDGNEFNTKKLLESYVRNKLTTIGKGIYDRTSDHFKVLHELIKRHPEYETKKGCGIKAFELTWEFNHSWHLEIIHKDDTKEDFSWLVCCGTAQLKTSKQLLNDAMRVAIEPDIQNFRQNHIECCRCGSTIKLQVHHEIHFDDIAKRYLDKYKPETLPTEFDDNTYHKATFKDYCNDFKQDWIKYHARKAKLSVLCADCHKKETSKSF